MARVLEIVLAAKDDYTPTLQKSFTDFVAWRKSIDAQMRAASHAQQYGGFQSNFDAQFARDREAMVQKQIAASKELASIEKRTLGETAATWGVAMFGARTALSSLLALAKGARGEFGDMWEAFARIPFFGPLIRDAKEFWDTVRGVRQDQEMASEAAKRYADEIKRANESAAYLSEANRDTLTDTEEATLKAHEEYAKTLADIDARHKPTLDRINAGEWGSGMLPESYTKEQTAAKERLARDIAKILDKSEEETRKKYREGLDKDHKFEVDSYMKRVREKQEIDREANQQYLAELRARNEREDEDRKSTYQDWVESMRPEDFGSGSTGAVSAEGVTGRFRGLAETSRNEALAVARETKNKLEEQNKILNQMLKLDEENGGALRRFFGNVGPL